jgi:hypothetical protein
MTRVVGVSHHQDGVATFVRRTGQVNRSFRMEQGGTCFFNERAPCVGEVDDPAFLTDKQPYLALVFEFVNLFAKRRLADAQDMSGAREVQLFGENNDRLSSNGPRRGETLLRALFKNWLTQRVMMTGELHGTSDEWLSNWNPDGPGKFHKIYRRSKSLPSKSRCW